ncbi:MAG: hypothetical protein AUI58_05125 [Chloroflexi bacterium 13_1_40CM_2_70_6]|nr:MAG: hypothetical protein AUI58_05125 [Chloroflexi bacterium 13_1_40CM_2_70_6]
MRDVAREDTTFHVPSDGPCHISNWHTSSHVFSSSTAAVPLVLNDRLAGKYAAATVSTVSLWKHSDFLKLWTGQTVSRLGSVVTRTALPLVALLTLGAGPPELAFLVISSSAGTLLVGLVAGAWVDRLRRRPVLVWTDVIRAALLFWIPIAYAIGALRIEQLYAVAFIEACLASLFNAAYPAYVPSLIGTERVVEGNSKLATSSCRSPARRSRSSSTRSPSSSRRSLS